jgi:alpha-beta hydrolase superfamily lysophospholipase
VHYLAQRYQQQGFVAVAPRLLGHGTAPGALTGGPRRVDSDNRLAVREATLAAGMTRRCTWLVTPTAGRWR